MYNITQVNCYFVCAWRLAMFKPMLACSVMPTFKEIKYPVIASPKLDGIRCLIIDGKPYSRSLKLIPNKFVQQELSKLNLPELDGELMLYNGDFNNVQSAVMSETGEPDFVFVVFDYFKHPKHPYSKRLSSCEELNISSERVKLIEYEYVHNEHRMEELFDYWVEHCKYEGAIIRSPFGPYKYGRSTYNQGWMLKLKVFTDAEATIVGFEELMHNANEVTVNNLGYQVRSSCMEGQYSGDTLGSLVVKFQNVEFKIGTGLDANERQRLWNMREELKGKLVTFKYQELSKYGVPRFPVYKGLRHIEDL